MRHDFATDHARERYIVEVDGQPKAEYGTFVKALTAGLQFRQEFPNSHLEYRFKQGLRRHRLSDG